MRNAIEAEPNHLENKEITHESLEAYVEGCEEMAVRLDTVIANVVEAGKRPVILIPSRGAVPIFLLARKFLDELHQDSSYLADRNARYYPEGVFNYLENKDFERPDEKTTVDVVLYPFTADVSLESTNNETIAKELRNSCARAVMQVVKGRDYRQHDLDWYKFLMKKMTSNSSDPDYLQPKNIIASLNSFPVDRDSQIILIDTVISGRAANDITNAFKTLGHTVVPILAVDNTKGGKFDNRRRREIEETVTPILEFLPATNYDGIFVEFPLITEDKGSALLGVVALNFINFNENQAFHKINKNFEEDFRPQSCVWALPANDARNISLRNFRNFIETTWNCRNGSKTSPTDQKIAELQAESRKLTATHIQPSLAEVNALVSVGKGTFPKKSASHIVSVRLTDHQASEWIGEFSVQINHASNHNGIPAK